MTRPSGTSEIVLYQTGDGKIKIDTIFQDETIWLTQAKMAELFDVKQNANEAGKILQPRRHHCRGLPGKLQTGHPIPHLGDQYPERIHHQRLCHG